MTLDEARKLLNEVRAGLSDAPAELVSQALRVTGDLPSLGLSESLIAWMLGDSGSRRESSRC